MEKHPEIQNRCNTPNITNPKTKELNPCFPDSAVSQICAESKLKMYSCTEEIPVEDMVMIYFNNNQYPDFQETFSRYLAQTGESINHKLPEWLMKCFLNNLENPLFKDLIKYYRNIQHTNLINLQKDNNKYIFTIFQKDLSKYANISKVIECDSKSRVSVKLEKSFFNVKRDILSSKGDSNILKLFRDEKRNEKFRADRFFCKPLGRTNDKTCYELINFEHLGYSFLSTAHEILHHPGNHHLAIILDSLCSLALLHEYGYENFDFAFENIAIGNPKQLTGKFEYYGKAIDYESICSISEVTAVYTEINENITAVASSEYIQAHNSQYYAFRPHYYTETCFLAFINNKKEMHGKTGSAAAGANIEEYYNSSEKYWDELKQSSPGHNEKRKVLKEIIKKLQDPNEKFFARDAARMIAEVTGKIDHHDYSWLKEEYPAPQGAEINVVKQSPEQHALTKPHKSTQYSQCTPHEASRINSNHGR